jgi:tRNA threonylcarbamoyladenosine biosynthesis protein TsaE
VSANSTPADKQENVTELTVAVSSESEMRELGGRLASALRPGDTILLDGPIGAGKSVLVRAALRSLGVTGHVPSPTFALAFSYPVGTMVVVHADAYRMEDPSEYVDLALEESYEDACVLIEWGSKLVDVVPDDYLAIVIVPTAAENARTVRFSSAGRPWEARMRQLGGAT